MFSLALSGGSLTEAKSQQAYPTVRDCEQSADALDTGLQRLTTC